MRAKPTKQAVIRKIAEDALDKVFNDLPDDLADALSTSVVRQWISYEGHAALLSGNARSYLQLIDEGERYVLQVGHVDGAPLHCFFRSWKINTDVLPEVLHNLNLCQSADVVSRDGLTLRFSINPKTRTISIEDLSVYPPK